jgi:TIR domain
MPGSTTPKIFLSFASEDDPWIRWFVKDIWFTKQIGNVRLQDYAAGDNLEFGELGQWVDEHVDEAAAVVAFISQYYMQKKWTVEELKKTMTAFRRKRLIFVPVMMDAEAKNWWADLRRQGELNALPVDYMYCDYTVGGKTASISGNDEIQRRIAVLARAIRDALVLPSTPSRSTEPLQLRQSEVIVLRHPTNRLAEEVSIQADALASAARGESLSVQIWNDGWLKDASARRSPSGTTAVFVQPLAAGEASEHVTDLGKTSRRLATVGVSDAPLILWLPTGQIDPDFENAALSSKECLPALPTLQATPALRTDPANNLAGYIRGILPTTAALYDDPVLQIETVGSPPGMQPDTEATRLSEKLTQSFRNIVNEVVSTEASSPWPFWDKQFKAQIALIRGSRAIVAVHDLDVAPSADKVANRKRIELKFQQMQDYARQTVNASNLKFFWAALLYKNASSLPFARYPFDARYKDWRLLSFEPAEDNSAGSPVPDLASLGVFRSELKAWAAG